MVEKEPAFGVEVKNRPERPFDALNITLPMPRLLRLPEETRAHLRAARREQLLAVRSLVDAAIHRLEEAAEKPRRRAERGKVEET